MVPHLFRFITHLSNAFPEKSAPRIKRKGSRMMFLYQTHQPVKQTSARLTVTWNTGWQSGESWPFVQGPGYNGLALKIRITCRDGPNLKRRRRSWLYWWMFSTHSRSVPRNLNRRFSFAFSPTPFFITFPSLTYTRLTHHVYVPNDAAPLWKDQTLC
jgi:hypothetical protein